MWQIGDMISIEVAVVEETSGFFGRSKISFLYVCKKIAMSGFHPLQIKEIQRLTDDAVAISECESLGGDCIYNWIYSDDLSQNECLDLNPTGWIGETDNCGFDPNGDYSANTIEDEEIGYPPPLSTNQCCKYQACIACCNGNFINDSQLINVYAIEPSFMDSYNEYNDSKNHLSVDWNIRIFY